MSPIRHLSSPTVFWYQWQTYYNAIGRVWQGRRMDGWLRLQLEDPRCRDARLVGNGVAELARYCGLVRCLRTLVLAGSVPEWVDLVAEHTADQLTQLCEPLPGNLSVRAYLLPEGQSEHLVGPVLNNVEHGILGDLLTEVVLTVLREHEKTETARLVVSLQRFVPADATAFAVVDPRADVVRVRACLGLAESLDEPLHFDRLTLSRGELRICEQQIAAKPTCTLGAGVGTAVRPVPAERQSAPVLTPAQARYLALLGVSLDGREHDPVELEFLLFDGQPFLARCRRVWDF